MTDRFFKPENYADQKTTEHILALTMPAYRCAYSDRTAYLMACLSELSYVEWESVTLELKKIIFNQVKEIVTNGQDENDNSLLLSELSTLQNNQKDVKQQLIADIGTFQLKVDQEHSFIYHNDNTVDTQALLVYNDDYCILAFRGTQATSVKDIRTDVDSKLVKCAASQEGRVHQGFQQAFLAIKEQLLEALNSKHFKDKPLYITGHSLGGAIATVATRHLKAPVKIAACYTFGSPRVGDEVWINQVKSPVFRLVNAADAVTMLPPNSVAVSGLSAVFEIIPVVGKYLKGWLKHIDGYMHTGNMRYLTNCPDGDYKNVKILYSVSLFYRLKAMWTHSILRRFAADHSMNVYRRKLERVALKRNHIEK